VGSPFPFLVDGGGFIAGASAAGTTAQLVMVASSLLVPTSTCHPKAFGIFPIEGTNAAEELAAHVAMLAKQWARTPATRRTRRA
jgi:hypothetical protein